MWLYYLNRVYRIKGLGSEGEARSHTIPPLVLKISQILKCSRNTLSVCHRKACQVGIVSTAIERKPYFPEFTAPSTITLGSSQLFNHASTLHDQKKQLNSENKILSLLLPVLLQCRSLAPLPSIRCPWLSGFLCGATVLYQHFQCFAILCDCDSIL